jgi:ribosome maturation factor RimP
MTGGKPEQRKPQRTRLSRVDPQRLRDCVAGIEKDIAEDGYELVDAIVGKFEGRLLIEILIDHERGITTEDCACCHQTVNNWFDAQDPVDGPYAIQVSSPGLDRPLRKPEHFVRFTGKLVRMKVREADGSHRRVRGRLGGLVEQSVLVTTDDEGELRIPFEDIVEARLEFEWE